MNCSLALIYPSRRLLIHLISLSCPLLSPLSPPFPLFFRLPHLLSPPLQFISCLPGSPSHTLLLTFPQRSLFNHSPLLLITLLFPPLLPCQVSRVSQFLSLNSFSFFQRAILLFLHFLALPSIHHLLSPSALSETHYLILSQFIMSKDPPRADR